MQRHIKKPYRINWKMYSLIGGISVVMMIVSVISDNITHNIISEIMKNLAFGCVASIFIALLLDIGNINEKNKKAISVYDTVYSDLKGKIVWYIETWSHFCSAAYRDEGYRDKKYTWIEWYEIAKYKFMESDDNKQKMLSCFLNESLVFSVEEIEKAIRQIKHQQYILNINGIYDEKLNKILDDYEFEFGAAKLLLKRCLENHFDNDEFWNSFDAINQDLINYINSWVDISFYNYVKFKPYKFIDAEEIMRAILKSELPKK